MRPTLLAALTLLAPTMANGQTSRSEQWLIDVPRSADTGWSGSLVVAAGTARLTLSYFRTESKGRAGPDQPVDSLTFAVPDSLTLVPGCQEREGEPSDTLVGLVKRTDTPWFPPPAGAWRLSVALRKIVPVTPDQIRCQNETYGVD